MKQDLDQQMKYIKSLSSREWIEGIGFIVSIVVLVSTVALIQWLR